MSTGYVSLTLGNLQVSCDKFMGDEFPRQKVEPAKSGLSALGTFVSYGRFYEERHKWTFNGVLKATDIPILDAIYWEHHRLRRTFQPAQILIVDTTQLFQERSPRTRATAPAPFNTVTTISGGTYLSYYAQFWGWFDSEPQYSKFGQYHTLVSLNLLEYADKVSP